MAITHSLIQTITVGVAGQASIEFTSIPQNYTDLLFVFSCRASISTGGIRIRVNGATTSLSTRLVYGTGTATASGSDTTYIGTSSFSTQTANVFGNGDLYIANYAASTNKSFSSNTVDENNGTSAAQFMGAGLFASSTAISSVSFFNESSGNFVQYSSASLYGIKNS